MLKKKNSWGFAFLFLATILILIGVGITISSELQKSSYKNAKKFAKVWCPYGAVNTELHLLQNSTFYCELVGSTYYGKYKIKGDKIYFLSDDLYTMGICHSYKILYLSKKSLQLKPLGNCSRREMNGLLY